MLRVGMSVLYEEHSLDPAFDADRYRRNRQLLIPSSPHLSSPRGFVKLHKDDDEWLDPRDRDRRIALGVIHEILPDGRVKLDKFGRPLYLSDIVDILHEATSITNNQKVEKLIKGLNASYPGDREKAARALGVLGRWPTAPCQRCDERSKTPAVRSVMLLFGL